MCSVYYLLHSMQKFGRYIRQRREALRLRDPSYSVRQVAARIGVEPSYLSKIERDLERPPSERRVRALARELAEDPDHLLAMAGKVSSDLHQAICHRPHLLATVIREIEKLSDEAIRRLLHRLRRNRRRKERQ